ncbi:hypothetical protein [Roseiconus lacunae]|uniref:hypothetical protein n=1 Tax=Roseiconus lacunae TaxID=2605694 RepID=UPI0011F19160|nr:hypothetical protein [Roseiconus lacunae]
MLDEQESFEVEICFHVSDRQVPVIDLVFQDDALVKLHAMTETSVNQISDGACWLDVSALTFGDSGVEFCLLFTDSTGPGSRNQTAFLEQLLALTWLDYVVDFDSSESLSLARQVDAALKELANLKCSSEIDVSKYFGVFF